MAQFYTQPNLSYTALNNQPDPTEMMMRFAQLKAYGARAQQEQMQTEEMMRQRDEQAGIRDAFRKNYGPQSATVNPGGMTFGDLSVPGTPSTVSGPEGLNTQGFIGDVGKINPEAAMGYQADLSKQKLAEQKAMADLAESMSKAGKEKLLMVKERMGITGSMLGAVLEAPPEARPQVYQQVYQSAVEQGLIQPGQYPEQYSPELEPHLAQAAQQSRTVEQMAAEHLAKATAKETATHNRATETQATATLAETKRKNLADAQREWYTAKTGRMSAEAAAKKKDVSEQAIDVAAQSLAAGDLTKLKDFPARGEARLLIFQRAKELNPKFNTAEVDRKIKMEDSFTNGKDGQNLQSFGTFLEHAGAASAAVDSVRNSNVPAINKPLNWWKKNMSGDPNFQAFATSLEPVRKEFESFLLGGRALYGDDRKAAETILSENSSPAQIQAALKQMGHTVQARYQEANHRYKRTMGHDLQDAISPEAQAGAQRIGVEVGSGGSVKMRAPNGQISDVPASQVEHYKSLGAIPVNQ